MSEEKKNMLSFVLDPQRAVFAIHDLHKVMEVTVSWCKDIARLLDEGKVAEAKELAEALSTDLPASFVHAVSRHSVPEDLIPPEMQEAMEKKRRQVAAGEVAGSGVEEVLVNVGGKKTLH